MECRNETCLNELEIDLSALNCVSNGSSGTHTTSYTYTGLVICGDCQTKHDVIINTDQLDDTGEILDIDIQ